MSADRSKPPRAPRDAEPGGSADQPASSASAYARAGVDLDHDERFVGRIAEIARSTHRPEILSTIGGFAGVFKAPDRYREPVFVASADGVGTKLKLAAELGRFDTVGIDCVAMVVNDLVVQGAEPIVFLDYLAMGKLEDDAAKQALRGIAEGCRRAGCALLGGETATMPGVYPPGEMELVGFGVGVAERSQLTDGSSVSEGDVIVGIASGGFHSNGYTLVRQVVDQAVASGRLDWHAENEELNTTLAAALLAPTRIYVKPILNLLRDFTIRSMAHITGGGFEGNLPRVLPASVCAHLDPATWPRPPVMQIVQREGDITEDEMHRVFNAGIGMALVVPREQAEDVVHRLGGLGERAYAIGRIERRDSDDPPVRLGPLPASTRR